MELTGRSTKKLTGIKKDRRSDLISLREQVYAYLRIWTVVMISQPYASGSLSVAMCIAVSESGR